MLHGGKEHSDRAVDGRSASWRRAAAMQRTIAPALAEAGYATWLLRYRLRGWNGGAPVVDARAALRRTDAELPGLPVVLLGHSMGARTAVHVADHPTVAGVVALAPWFPPGETVAAVPGRTLRVLHGARDRITSARASAAYVERAAAAGADATFESAGWAGHYMFTHVARWNAFALERSLEVLAAAHRGVPDSET
ncbi:alpha/beta hydrolase [Nocardioides zeae]|uniref:Alpha/beta hydrolase n=2 Tax=Nocardioides zeae TaxID=1457234 RepID=A0A6P0HVF1_9ACTN|nr:alpha/beta fold hydrolase [Nocardioides zeae]NEN80655.1 alpha/beta hydrolase [Nocardioides zeae]